jgi:hypothetical protein
MAKQKELEEFFNNSYNQSKQQAKYDHSSKGKIKFEVFFFNTNIAGQAPDPVKLIMKKINDHTCRYNEQADNDDPFSYITVHAAKLRFNIF